MHTISPLSLLLIAVVVLVLFGRGKISALMGEAGKGITAFKKGLNDGDGDTNTPAALPAEPIHAPTVTPDPHNPNRCETCLGNQVPAERHAVSDTGRCGACGRTDEVWDLPHLADLAAAGQTVHDPDHPNRRVNRPIRASHLPM